MYELLITYLYAHREFNQTPDLDDKLVLVKFLVLLNIIVNIILKIKKLWKSDLELSRTGSLTFLQIVKIIKT